MQETIGQINIGNFRRQVDEDNFMSFYVVAKKSNVPDEEIVQVWNKYAKFAEHHVWLNREPVL